MKQQKPNNKLTNKLIFGLSLILVLILFLALPVFQGFAQNKKDLAKEREALEQQLKELEELIAKYEADITKTEQEKKTLQNQIYILRNKIYKLDLQIKESLENIKSLKTYLENQKQSLDEEKEDLERMVKIQILQKQESQAIKKKQEYFLKLTEAEYQKYLREKKETEEKAAKIRARIFELIGIPEAPTFGQAYELAKYVETITGIRPAFLLAILKQESNIGKNVGRCFLKNPKTGEGVRVKTGEKQPGVMAPGPPYHSKRNDVAYFLEITKELGRDPYNTLVSCPINDPARGLIPGKTSWGGAMGPAQFIPSTWVLYKDKVEKIITFILVSVAIF